MRLSSQIIHWWVGLASLVVILGCGSDITPISGTPSASQVLSNARSATRQLESYRATVTTIETTVHPQRPAADFENRTTRTIDVASHTNYSVDSPALDHRLVRADGIIYQQLGGGDWIQGVFEESYIDVLREEASQKPPWFPGEWLDSRLVVDSRFEGQERIDGKDAYVILGRIPMLPGISPDVHDVPEDFVWLYVDAESFQVIRIEIDQNITDSLREDSGYQVIPGVVEIDTREIIDYSHHNSEIVVATPESWVSR